LKELKGIEEKQQIICEEESTIIAPSINPVPEEELKKPEEPEKSEEVKVKNQIAQDKKRIQREKEKEKRQENEMNGIFAKDLLTKENFTLWKSNNFSNAYISREIVGCREEEVAKAKKKFNI
jgi:hypothetical protein